MRPLISGCRQLLFSLLVSSVVLTSAVTGDARGDERFITVASTTSTQNSGLFDAILPRFLDKSGIEVRVVAVGTGAAVRLARSGDADVLLVHHQPSEEKLVADGFSDRRYPLMFNDFVIVGPGSDPAAISGISSAVTALSRISNKGALFASRGDDSGTHKKELSLWRAAEIDVSSASGGWYRETGSGMGATLNIAAAMDAYALTDRGTWISFKNRQGLDLLVEGDRRLRNEYGVLVISKERFPHIKEKDAQTFVEWLLSEDGRAAINSFRVNGKVLFHAMTR